MKNFWKIAVLVVLVITISGFLLISALPDWETRGTFGDMFGVVNALFSGMAFAGVIYAIILQHQELSLQREELKLTRQEFSRSAAAQEKSEKALNAQAKASSITARLAAANYLFGEADATLRSITVWSHGDPNHQRRIFAERTKAELLREINEMYERLKSLDDEPT